MSARKASLIRPYLELVRLPAVFTAPADVLCGAVLVAGGTPSWSIAGAVVSSACIYCAGMAANDVFDAEVDARERPKRPLPSGRVSRRQAWTLILALQVIAVLVALSLGMNAAFAAAATIAATYTYNASLKSTWAGPLAMGACRYLNALLGMVAVSDRSPWDLPGTVLCVPLFTLTFVAALTTVSHFEAHGGELRRLRLALGAMVLCAALPAAAIWSSVFTTVLKEPVFGVATLLPVVFVGRAAISAAKTGAASDIRGAVMAGIFAIAMVNGVFAAAVGAWPVALLIVALLVPGRLVGKWFYAT